MPPKPTDHELLEFFLAFVREHGNARGMQQAAGVRFEADRQTIRAGLDRLRQRRAIGRDVFQSWRDD